MDLLHSPPDTHHPPLSTSPPTSPLIHCFSLLCKYHAKLWHYCRYIHLSLLLQCKAILTYSSAIYSTVIFCSAIVMPSKYIAGHTPPFPTTLLVQLPLLPSPMQCKCNANAMPSQRETSPTASLLVQEYIATCCSGCHAIALGNTSN